MPRASAPPLSLGTQPLLGLSLPPRLPIISVGWKWSWVSRQPQLPAPLTPPSLPSPPAAGLPLTHGMLCWPPQLHAWTKLTALHLTSCPLSSPTLPAGAGIPPPGQPSWLAHVPARQHAAHIKLVKACRKMGRWLSKVERGKASWDQLLASVCAAEIAAETAGSPPPRSWPPPYVRRPLQLRHCRVLFWITSLLSPGAARTTMLLPTS